MYSVVMIYDGMFTIPMTPDSECDGALCVCGESDPIALFRTRSDAQRSVTISRCYARLRQAQGLPSNTDWTDGSVIRIVRAREQEVPRG